MLSKELADFQITFRDLSKLCTESLLAELLSSSSGLVVGKETVSAALLGRVPNLKMVAKYGVGLDNVDVEACQRAGVTLSYSAGVNADSVAEHTLGLMLSLVRNIGLTSKLLGQGDWRKDGGRDLGSLTVGIVGFGNIGLRVGRLVRAFGCTVQGTDILDKGSELASVEGVQVDLDTLLKSSDVCTLHVPLTAATRCLINGEKLSLMKSNAYLINTSRGGVIAQEDLKTALKNKTIRGAALDVFQEEPLLDKDLYSLDNFIGTPHIAAGTREAREAMAKSVIEAIKRFYG